MVRSGSLILAIACSQCLAIGGDGPAQEVKPPSSRSIETEPYRARALIAADPEARLDAGRRARLVKEWLELVGRFVGAPWEVEVLDEVEAAPVVPEGPGWDDVPTLPESMTADVEKVWLVRLTASGSGFVLTGREFDTAAGRFGPVHRREAPVARDLARELLHFALELFEPYAEIGERFGTDVSITVRGAALTAASPIGKVVKPGAIFRLFRVAPVKGAADAVRDIPYTYLRVESVEPSGARCSFLSVFSDPFTRRVVQKTRLIALGLKPGDSPTRLRFSTLPDRAPAAGYVLTARSVPGGLPRDLGRTDREGRITLPAAVSDGLLVFRLTAGGDEPMIEFPFMPGDPGEQAIPPFDPKPQTVALTTRLDSLRDEVVDLVAVRARLEARLKARYDGEDWEGAEAALKEFEKLPPRESFVNALNSLREDAARRQAETKTAILTRTAQARIAELQGLMERYLDDEGFRAFADALQKLKAGPKPEATPKPSPTASARRSGG